MRSKQSVILLEFNELVPTLIHRFIGQGKLPNFQRLYSESQVFTTDAQEPPPYLNPWIQWITIHSGLPYSEHKIFHLGEGHKLQKKCIWDLVSDAGMKSWICGAMNVRFDKPMNGWMLPDPWTVGATPYPEALTPYFKFVQTNVQEHSNDRVPLKRKDYVDFLLFMLKNGLSIQTIAAIVKQLVSERFDKTHWKRAAILDKLQFDLFRSYYLRERPSLSAFFLNSTAHFQHMHWREMEPEHFKVKPSDEDHARYRDAILFGYEEMDRLLGRFYRLCDQNTTLIFATAFSQQACATYEDQGGKSVYRPHDMEAFARAAGVTAPVTVSAVMSEQFHVFFRTEAEAGAAYERLKTLSVNGKPALKLERNGTALFTGCGITEALPRNATITIGADGRTLPFFDAFYRLEGLKSGMHHPDGMLWIRHPQSGHGLHPQKVLLTDIAPTVLQILGVEKPGYMRGRPLIDDVTAHHDTSGLVHELART